MTRKLIAAAVTMAAGLLLGTAGPAHAQDVAPKPTSAEAQECGYTDTLYWNSTKDQRALTCRWRANMGTLYNNLHTENVTRGDVRHFVNFYNYSGRDIHLAYYRQGKRDGRWITSNLAYNALIPKGDNRGFIRDFAGTHYEQVRALVRHRATGRDIYTPSISLELCTGPGGQC